MSGWKPDLQKIITIVALVVSILVGTASLALGYGQAGAADIARWFLVLAAIWLFTHFRKWYWFSSIALIIVVVAAAYGVWQEFPTVWLLLGAVGATVVLVRDLAQRQGELALMHAIGMSRTATAMAVAAEHSAPAIVGIILGAAGALAGSVAAGQSLATGWALALPLLVAVTVVVLSTLISFSLQPAAASNALRTA